MENKWRNIPISATTSKEYSIEQKWKFDNNTGSREWQRYLQVLQQLIGLISVKGNDDFENRQNLIFECCYANGGVVLSFKGGRLQIWTIAGELKFDINGDVEYVDVLPFVGIGYTGYIKQKKLRLKGDDCVYIKSEPFGLSLWVLWWRIIKDNVQLMNIYLTNAKLNVKKLQWIINNDSEDITEEEIESMLDPETPFIKTLNPITKAITGNVRAASGEQNVIQALPLSSGDYNFEDVVNHWIFETNLMGLFADEYKKKERNTTGENEFTQANTILIHEVFLRGFKRAEKEIKTKFGIDVEFYKTFELSVEDKDSESMEGDQDETK